MADNQQKQLLTYYSGLDEERQRALLEYAAYLYQRSEKKPTVLGEPNIIPRPDEETVVGAIKRLSASYEMIDKQTMLHELSGLMAQHMLQGRPADEVITEIESVFTTQYQLLMDKQED